MIVTISNWTERDMSAKKIPISMFSSFSLFSKHSWFILQIHLLQVFFFFFLSWYLILVIFSKSGEIGFWNSFYLHKPAAQDKGHSVSLRRTMSDLPYHLFFLIFLLLFPQYNFFFYSTAWWPSYTSCIHCFFSHYHAPS